MPLSQLDKCLFCGIDLNDDIHTQEDVFPKWLQREYGLEKMTLTLLNGSARAYRKLLVPACAPCNNNHASQLEKRVSEDRATDLDMWIWMLKLQLGSMAFETGRPWILDKRDPLSEEPIVDSLALDLRLLHGIFDALKHDSPQFLPNPLGSVFSFPTTRTDFFYMDKLYRNGASRYGYEYSASCICLHGKCWIALFDDVGNVLRQTDIPFLTDEVEKGYDPVFLFPEFMYTRSRLDHLPSSTIIRSEKSIAVTMNPGARRVETLEHVEEVRQLFFEECFPGIQVPRI